MGLASKSHRKVGGNMAISWIGNIFIVIGLWFIGSKKRWAFIFSMLGEALWIAAAVRRHEFDLAFICVIFFALAARSYVKWGA
jgi:hypothetical protein